MPRQLKADKKMFFSSSAGYRGTHIISFQPPKCEINEDCKQLLHHSYQHDWFAGRTTTEATSNDIRRRLDAEGETWCLICTGWLPDLRH